MNSTSLTTYRNKLIRNGDLLPKVLFDNIADTYSLNENVACEYSLVDYDAKPEDRIYLLKSGWKSLKNYETYEWAVYGKGRVNLAVIFKKYSLPQDLHEFYQFCYVTEGNVLCGASKIFQFSNTSLTSMVIVSSPGNSLNFESHSNIKHNCFNEQPHEENSTVKSTLLFSHINNRISRSSTKESTDEDCNNCKKRLEEHKKDVEDLKTLIEKMITSQQTTNKNMEDMNSTLTTMRNEYKKLEDDMKNLQEEYNKLLRNSQQKEENSAARNSTVSEPLLEVDSLPPFPKLELPKFFE